MVRGTMLQQNGFATRNETLRALGCGPAAPSARVFVADYPAEGTVFRALPGEPIEAFRARVAAWAISYDLEIAWW